MFPSLVGGMAVQRVVTESLAQLSASTSSSFINHYTCQPAAACCHPIQRRRVEQNVRALSPLCHSDFIFYPGQLHVLSIQRQI